MKTRREEALFGKALGGAEAKALSNIANQALEYIASCNAYLSDAFIFSDSRLMLGFIQ